MTRSKRAIHHDALLIAALEGLESERLKIEEQISMVRSALGGRAQTRAGKNAAKKRSGAGRLSPEARERIAAAQRRRWAEYRKRGSSSAAE